MKKKLTILIFSGVLLSSALHFVFTDSKPELHTSGGFKRIIVLSPALTECVFALGAGHLVVGVSDFVTYPPEALEIPRVGGYLNPSYETIIALEPELLIMQGESEKLVRFCDAHGIRFEKFPMDSIGDLYSTLENLGRLLNAEAAADSLYNEIRFSLQEISSKTRGLPRPGVFFSMGHSPSQTGAIFTTGRGSFIHELIEIAGGENCFSDAKGLYPQISRESLIKKAPDIILESFRVSSSVTTQMLLGEWSRFPSVPAVINQRIYFLDEPVYEILGPRIPQTARRLASMIHPGVMDDE